MEWKGQASSSSSSSFLRAIWSVITNGHSSHFFNFTESLLYMTYQHKPTEASLLASSWGALSHWHAECILQPSRTWPHILWRGTWTVQEMRNVHPLQWGVSTWTLGPSEQCHQATPPCVVDAKNCTWQRCPDGVLFSKWRSHSFVIKMIIAVKCSVKCKRLT